jgi:hypothetical protein
MPRKGALLVTCLCSPLNRETLASGEQLRFDHGAQYFSAKDPAVEALVQEWVAAGVAALWSPRLGSWEAGGGFVPEEVSRLKIVVYGLNVSLQGGEKLLLPRLGEVLLNS